MIASPALLRPFCALVLTVRIATALPASPDADRAALLAGVTAIVAPGAPGAVCAFGPGAFAVVAGKEGKASLLPVVAATRWEKGRVIAFGHNGYFGASNDPDTGRLLANATRWAAGDVAKPKIAIHRQGSLLTFLKGNGFDAEALEGEGWNKKLDGFRVLAIDAHALKEADLPAISKWLRGGGGLIIAATGWGWLSGASGKNLATDFVGNQLLAPTGLVFADGTPDKTADNGYTTGGDLSLLGASAALDAILAHTQNKAPLQPTQLTQAAATLSQAMRSLPPDDKVFRPRIAALRTLPGANEFPRPDKPLRSSDALARLLFTENIEALKRARPEQLRVHPAADAFPGAVPKDAPRVKGRVVTIDTAVPQWHSTGLYAAPGELIQIAVPPAAADKGLAVRIGCHTDGLWHLDKWQRAPEISRREPLKQSQTAAANAFGGLVYIDVPGDCALGTINVTISGAVEAPRYIRGVTNVADWKAKIRNFPAPWAELETKKIVLSVPSEKIRQLEDPDALMAVWDQVLDAEADLAAIPRERKRPERIVPDTQISAGYMHSGYPIMTFLDHSVEHSLSTVQMKQGSWGHFHELGHNHQQGDWTFGGTTEVTCNLFSLYVCETLCGLPPGTGHEAMQPDAVAKRLRKHLETRASFERWKDDPFLALTMYNQLRASFGWEPYKQVFAEYRALPKSERPRNDDEKRDQWMVRFSRTVGKNLGPFFETWGVPTSETARASIKDLPAWMPEDWPKL